MGANAYHQTQVDNCNEMEITSLASLDISK